MKDETEAINRQTEYIRTAREEIEAIEWMEKMLAPETTEEDV